MVQTFQVKRVLSMVGRKRDSRQIKLEKSIRSATWFNYLMAVSGAETAYQLEGKMEFRERIWSNYAKGKSSPNQNTLNYAESLYPGSLNVFESGPDNSYLFMVMCDDFEDIADLADDGNGIFIWLNALMPDHNLRQTDNSNLWAVVGQLKDMLIEDKLFECADLQTDQTTTLRFLSGCLLILRIAIERDYFHQYSYVPEISDLVFDCLENSQIGGELHRYSINILMLRWLYCLLGEWSNFSTQGTFLKIGGFPSEDQFLDDPRVFIRHLDDGYKICAAIFECDDIDSSEDIRATKRLKVTTVRLTKFETHATI